jgi:hypothetical protein
VQAEEDGGHHHTSVMWGDGIMDFSECCTPECIQTEEAIYRIRSYVHYCRKPPTPSLSVSTGHFASFFMENDVWYHCDDLLNAAQPTLRASPPGELPYICFFEKVGRSNVAPPDLMPNPMRVPNLGTQSSSISSQDSEEDRLTIIITQLCKHLCATPSRIHTDVYMNMHPTNEIVHQNTPALCKS